MHPVLRMITRTTAGVTARNLSLHHPRWTRGCETVASAAARDKRTQHGAPHSETSLASTFACVGIDTDMNGAVVLVTCKRNDSVMQHGLGEDETVVSL